MTISRLAKSLERENKRRVNTTYFQRQSLSIYQAASKRRVSLISLTTLFIIKYLEAQMQTYIWYLVDIDRVFISSAV